MAVSANGVVSSSAFQRPSWRCTIHNQTVSATRVLPRPSLCHILTHVRMSSEYCGFACYFGPWLHGHEARAIARKVVAGTLGFFGFSAP